MKWGTCYDCIHGGPVLRCTGCGAEFCHDDFEFHDCERVRGQLDVVQRILDANPQDEVKK